MNGRSWRIDRRTFLRGAGVACALPQLEAMASGAAAPAARPKRLCYVYFPNGVSLPPEDDSVNARWRWFPEGHGADYRPTEVLAPLERHRDDLTILGGLSHPKSRRLLGHLAGDTWLTGGDLRGAQYRNQISADQLAAATLGRDTRYPSLVLSTDGGVGYKSRVATLSFDDRGMPIPAEHRQRAIFERYFAGGGDKTDRKKSLARGKKIVDLVLEDARDLARSLGEADRRQIDEYLTSVGSVEDQIRRNERWLGQPLPTPPGGPPDLSVAPAVDPSGYLGAMFDLIKLALQTDLTRVVTFMMAREDGIGFGENFPKLAVGIDKGHHTISHDAEPGHWEEWGRYDQWLTNQFASFLDRLKGAPDGDATLLDNTLTLYGSACSTTHNAVNYPLVLAGGAAMGLRHGRYLRQEEETPMANLLLTMLQTVGVPAESFADSTEPLPGLVGA
ncbi:DUF1552 domain-containing protein [Botrimarina sp.]|uniref:DUF1552 domain-containing protein n=1 Tax=Botrimarina sp. TaxID=2795802 RepID=UPI0032ED3E77